MVNLILNLNIRVKRVADTKNPKLNLNISVKWVADIKINRLENVPNCWDVFYVNDYGDVLLTNKMYNARITVILMKG